MYKTQYKGYWIEQIEYNTATLLMIYPKGKERPDPVIADKALDMKTAKIIIDCWESHT